MSGRQILDSPGAAYAALEAAGLTDDGDPQTVDLGVPIDSIILAMAKLGADGFNTPEGKIHGHDPYRRSTVAMLADLHNGLRPFVWVYTKADGGTHAVCVRGIEDSQLIIVNQLNQHGDFYVSTTWALAQGVDSWAFGSWSPAPETQRPGPSLPVPPLTRDEDFYLNWYVQAFNAWNYGEHPEHDPRQNQAFLDHLVALEADWTDPSRYGLGHWANTTLPTETPVLSPAQPVPTPSLPAIPDTTGVDIANLIYNAASKNDLPPYAVHAMLIAESGMNPFAVREGVWPDVSYGYSQIIVPTAAGYGIGDGSDTPANRAAVKAALFDRWTSINLGAQHMALCARRVRDELGIVQEPDTDAWILHILACYNSGSPRSPESWYWTNYAGNVRSYENAIRQAKQYWP